MSRIYSLEIDEFIEVAKALSTELRIEIFKELQKKTLTIQEICDIFDLPASTAAVNIKKLEEANLIKTEIVPGSRGTQKICSSAYDRIIVDVPVRNEKKNSNARYINMPIGHFTDCQIQPTCGIATENGVIGYYDDPRSFFEIEAINAQILWFRHGYVEYRFPNKIPYDSVLKSIEISMEICSEAPLYKEDWPSDITLWINDVEIGTWMSPGDFGGKRALLTPQWWDINMTQHGLLKKWTVNREGSFIDSVPTSNITVSDININEDDFFKVRIGIKEDAENQGGLNLFGRRFGNYEQDIVVRLDVEPKKK